MWAYLCKAIDEPPLLQICRITGNGNAIDALLEACGGYIFKLFSKRKKPDDGLISPTLLYSVEKPENVPCFAVRLCQYGVIGGLERFFVWYGELVASNPRKETKKRYKKL